MADIAALEAAESSYTGAASSSSVVPPRAAAQGQGGEGSAQAGQKRKMRITCKPNLPPTLTNVSISRCHLS